MNSDFDFSTLDMELNDIDIDLGNFGFDTSIVETNNNEYEEQELKENKTQLHKCPECGCEFED